MQGQLAKIVETMIDPDKIIRSSTDSQVDLFYRHYLSTPVTTKFLCVVLKVLSEDNFVITAYFTNTVKKGDVIWEKK